MSQHYNVLDRSSAEDKQEKLLRHLIFQLPWTSFRVCRTVLIKHARSAFQGDPQNICIAFRNRGQRFRNRLDPEALDRACSSQAFLIPLLLPSSVYCRCHLLSAISRLHEERTHLICQCDREPQLQLASFNCQALRCWGWTASPERSECITGRRSRATPSVLHSCIAD